jgi:hypothetical protein
MSRKTAPAPRRLSGQFPRISGVTPLPGSRTADIHDWVEAMVMPLEQAPWQPSPQRDRSLVYKAECERSQQFRESLLSFLQKNHLMNAVRWISEAGSTTMITLCCAPHVLELLQRSQLFEAGRTMGLEMYT